MSLINCHLLRKVFPTPSPQTAWALSKEKKLHQTEVKQVGRTVFKNIEIGKKGHTESEPNLTEIKGIGLLRSGVGDRRSQPVHFTNWLYSKEK